jgi:hypothetical protein
MLIPYNTIIDVLNKHDIRIHGALHIGAHDCEEIPFYNSLGLELNDIVWIDAFKSKVSQAESNNIPNVYHATITDKDYDVVDFHVANNIQSSSVLPFGTHSAEHPHVVCMYTVSQSTLTIPTFFNTNGLDSAKYNFWNFDIQGAELMALKGAFSCIPNVDAMYLEVNEKELYKGCGLIGDIDTFLEKYGFSRELTQMTQHGWGDALYVRKRRA